MTTEQKLVPPDVADGEEDFVASLQSFASYCESGAFSPDDGPMLASKFRDAAFVVDQLMKLRDGKIASGFRLAPAAPAPEPVGCQYRIRAIGKYVGEWSEWREGKAPVLRVDYRYETEERLIYTTPPAPVAARVKALEWRVFHSGYGSFEADTTWGDYVIQPNNECWRLWYPSSADDEYAGEYPTLEAAKAAAQSDYERRVLACLEPGHRAISPAEIAGWEATRGQEMQSAIGEYVPEEFWRLLDAYKAVAFGAVESEQGWQAIESAPHATDVLLATPPSPTSATWTFEVGPASTGQRWPNGASSMSFHGYATHWMPLPAAPGEG